MNITLYQSTAEKNRLNKADYLTVQATYSGTLREDCSVITPSVEVQSIGLPQGNYAYILEFNRYYFIREIVATNNGLWRLSLEVDVLYTYNAQIRTQTAQLSRYRYSDTNVLYDNKWIMEDVFDVSYISCTEDPDRGFDMPEGEGFQYMYVLSVYDTENGTFTGKTPINCMSKKYAVTFATIQGIAKFLTSSPDNSKWGNINLEPSECIQSITVFPYDFQKAKNLSALIDVRIAGETIPITITEDVYRGYDLSGVFAYGKVGGSRPDFTDYGFTIESERVKLPFSNEKILNVMSSFSLFVPFYGFVDLDSNILFGDIDKDGTHASLFTHVYIRYNIDENGNYFAEICACSVIDEVEENTTVIKTVGGRLAFDIPVSRTNLYEMKRNESYIAGTAITSVLLSPLAGVATTAMTGNAIAGGATALSGIVGAGVNGILQLNYKNPQRVSSTPSTPSAMKNPNLTKPYLLVQKPRPTQERDDDYANLLGFPESKIYNLSKVNGYAEISAIHLENIPTALSEELEKIERLLKNGVHF